MNYLNYEIESNVAIKKWYSLQYDFADIVLSLTDNDIFEGAKIYALFSRNEVLNLMSWFSCDFIKIKQELGIIGDYIVREDDIFSNDFNPKRKKDALTLSSFEMSIQAQIIYQKIMQDLEELSKGLIK